MEDERWIKHIRRLASDKAKIQVEVRDLRLENSRLKDELRHYSTEFARQNARILELTILKEMNDKTGNS